jgi:UDP-3-O-[3-hydroxymyristoyl] glucosamine N-acyltransferase
MSRARGPETGRWVTLGELADLVGGVVVGDPSTRITGLNGIREAVPGDITFLSNPRYARYLETTRASAVIMKGTDAPSPRNVLDAPEPYAAFLKVLEFFAGSQPRTQPGVHPTAVLGRNLELGSDITVGPYVVLEDNAQVGDRSVLMAGVFIGESVRIGRDCVVHPHAVVREKSRVGDRVILHSGAVIGDDGFGFVPHGDGYRKIPHIGRVVLEDDVEVGANTTIDRATVGETRIGRGTRIDNLVQIAHNVTVGENSILCGQVGISGSTEVGSGVTLAGQVGIVGHVSIGDGVKVGAQGGVTKSIDAGQEVSGYPALPHALARRIYASMRQLPEALQKLRELSERLEKIERSLPK